MDEENIVRRMIDGDMEAFGTLMEQYEKPALRAAWLISGNAADSEDIVQETFTACYLNRKKLREPAAFKTWFYRILTRSAWKICKKTGRERPEEEPASGQEDTKRSVLETCIMKEEERILFEAVEKLPPKQKTVLILYYYNDMPIREVAKVCGVFEGTVKSRLYHAKEQLKKVLTQEEGGKTWTILS